VHSDKLSAASTLFTLVGRIHYATGKVSAFVAGSSQTQHYSEQLNVTVGGAPRRQRVTRSTCSQISQSAGTRRTST
jgi:hypothetical protein